MRYIDKWTSLFWAGVGIYVSYEGYNLKLGTLGSPGCGFFIFWAGIILTGLSLVLFFQTYLPPSKMARQQSMWKGLRWVKVIKMMTALLLYTLIFKWLGFIISTFLLLLYLFKGLEPQRWTIAFMIAAITTAVCYLVFGLLLELQFPFGVLQKIIG